MKLELTAIVAATAFYLAGCTTPQQTRYQACVDNLEKFDRSLAEQFLNTVESAYKMDLSNDREKIIEGFMSRQKEGRSHYCLKKSRI